MFKTIVKNQKTTIDKSMFGKRFAVSLLSACMLFSGFSAFAADGDGAVDTPVIQNPAVVEEEVSPYFAVKGNTNYKVTGDKWEENGVLSHNYRNVCTVAEDGTVTVDSEDNSELILLSTGNDTYSGQKGCYKSVLNFDLKVNNDNTGGTIYFYDTGNKRLGTANVSKEKLSFSYNGGNPDYAIEAEKWYNIKCVTYPTSTSETADDIDRIEWYVDNNLIGISKMNEGGTRTHARVFYLSGKGISFKNQKLVKINKNTVEAATTIENVVDLTTANVLSTSTAVKEDNEGLYMDTNGVLLNVDDKTLDYGTNNAPVYHKYSFSYDIKLTADYQDNQRVAQLYYRDGVMHYNGTAESNTGKDVGYMGIIHVFGKHLQFSQNGEWSMKETYPIEKDVWYNIEYVMEPSTGDFVWYVNGEKVSEGSVSKSTNWYASKKRILKSFRADITSGTDVAQSGDIRFDNFKLSGIKNTVKPAEVFAATSVVKNESGLDVAFNKDVDSAQALLNYIKVTDRFGKAVSTSASVSDVDKKVVKLAIENVDSSWYKVSVPSRFLSADGLALGKTTVLSTPHFEVVNPVINVENSIATLNATYTNTTDNEVNTMVVLAAYNENGTLAQVAVANRTVAETNGSVTEQTQSDKVNVTVPENGTVKAFVFDKTTYQPLCGIIEQTK